MAPQKKESGSGVRRYLPYVFTEQGIAMLSAVLKKSLEITKIEDNYLIQSLLNKVV